MAAATGRPAQVLGLHFFNPVPLMKLVEVVQTILTNRRRSMLAAWSEWGACRRRARCRWRTKDSTAFIVNRLLVPYLLDAIRAYGRAASPPSRTSTRP